MFANNMKHIVFSLLCGGSSYVWSPGSEFTPGPSSAHQRRDYGEVVLRNTLTEAACRLNPSVPFPVLQTALEQIFEPRQGDEIAVNAYFHSLIVHGVPVEYECDGEHRRQRLALIDFQDIGNNRYAAVSDFEIRHHRRSLTIDALLFINGLPLVLILYPPRRVPLDVDPETAEAGIFAFASSAHARERRNARNTPDIPDTTAAVIQRNQRLEPQYHRLQHLRRTFPRLFHYNCVTILGDGHYARAGAHCAPFTRFTPWQMDSPRSRMTNPHLDYDGTVVSNQFPYMFYSLLRRHTLLDIIRRFTLFENLPSLQGGAGGVGELLPHSRRIIKKIAAPHQYFAVQVALDATCRAVSPGGDRRIGVVWHTQGAGKSLTMLFYAARLRQLPGLDDPAVIVLTDRNHLDDQLYETFCVAAGVLRHFPQRAQSRRHLRRILRSARGGIFFTTLQKFFSRHRRRRPVLSHRTDIIVIVDEAHRSQYDFIDGFARHLRDALPNASFIAFTGTPLQELHRNTRTVFGDYIHIFNINDAVGDNITVPVYYRDVSAHLRSAVPVRLDPEPFWQTLSKGEACFTDRCKSAQLERLLGCDQRLRELARHLTHDFLRRNRETPGKAMVALVSRRVCIALYNHIVALYPQWHHDDDCKGRIKVVVTSAAGDPVSWAPHGRDKERRRLLARRFKDPQDPLRIVIVCDMWLTGFDVPSLHTLYIDKPMRGHALIQAVSRVNRVFPCKAGGLVVDYLGISTQLREALNAYSRCNTGGPPFLLQQDALADLHRAHQELVRMFPGGPYRSALSASYSFPPHGRRPNRSKIFTPLLEALLQTPERRLTFLSRVTLLKRAYSLAVPHPAALRMKEPVRFFVHLGALLRRIGSTHPDPVDASHLSAGEQGPPSHRALNRLAAYLVRSADVFDFFSSSHPNISAALSHEPFLQALVASAYPNVAFQVLAILLEKEIKRRSSRNIVLNRFFQQSLDRIIQRRKARDGSPGRALDQLVALVRRLRESHTRHRAMQLTESELAFYDALTLAVDAVGKIGEPHLKDIARQLARQVEENATLDWAVKESARARLRVAVKRTLRLNGYPLSEHQDVLPLLLQQTETQVRGVLNQSPFLAHRL